MKHLANCDALDFLRQTNKIRKAVEGWLKATKVMDIRKKMPKLDPITGDMDEAEKAKITEKNRIKAKEQMKKSLSDFLDNALDENAEKTLELLALMCFVEPQDANSHKATEYLKAFGEMIADEDVLDFFTSLMRLEQKGILDISSL
jgi:hypothetical protein